MKMLLEMPVIAQASGLASFFAGSFIQILVKLV